jgi:hypothetical protein
MNNKCVTVRQDIIVLNEQYGMIEYYEAYDYLYNKDCLPFLRTPTIGPYITGIAYDGVNLISISSKTEELYIHDGLNSEVILSRFNLGDGFENVLIYGSVMVSFYPSLDEVCYHDGVSPEILSKSSYDEFLEYKEKCGILDDLCEAKR